MKRHIAIIAMTIALGACIPLPAFAQLSGATSIATSGSFWPSSHRDIHRFNPAWRGVLADTPAQEKIFDLPLGLPQLIDDFPQTNPGKDDFDLTALIDLGIRSPWAMDLRLASLPSTGIAYLQDPQGAQIRLADLRTLLPEESFSMADVGHLPEWGHSMNLGQRWGVIRFAFIEPFTFHDLEMDLTGDLEALAAGGALDPSKNYRLEGRQALATGFRSGVIYSRGIRWGPFARPSSDELDSTGDWTGQYWDALDSHPRLWLGIGLRRMTGLAGMRMDGSLELEESTREEHALADYDVQVQRAHARWLGDLGGGYAVDLGAAIRWGKTDLGLGVSDLFAQLSWDETDQHRLSYDPAAIEPVLRESQEGQRKLEIDIPTRMFFHVQRQMKSLALSADMQSASGSTRLHLGGRTRTAKPWQILAGLERDPRGLWQIGAGMQWQLRRTTLVLGWQTHSNSLDTQRDLSMGMSLVFR